MTVDGPCKNLPINKGMDHELPVAYDVTEGNKD